MTCVSYSIKNIDVNTLTSSVIVSVRIAQAACARAGWNRSSLSDALKTPWSICPGKPQLSAREPCIIAYLLKYSLAALSSEDSILRDGLNILVGS